MKKFRCDSCHITADQIQPMIIPYCPNCGQVSFMSEVLEEKSDREKAIEWYDSLPIGKAMEVRRNFGVDVTRKSVTDKEIEQIWRKEKCAEKGVQTHKEFEDKIKEQVDFELLKIQIQDFINDESYSEGARSNLKLFFDLLSKSSTFAHKAHKELQRLNR